ncbi:hypothetical protein [Dyella sp.]|uniref:hypothetical protein n=1 Tax=Dyella sp. TaxID=1869338 RepID=UPI00284CD425|nr:hypothetical protein [Dyella sp.]MDR3446934.1 hypothetical protein [Dyella sp.]
MEIKTIRKGPLGQCMYCEDNHPPLTNEHIMSRGLNGEWLLLQSTCNACKKKIDTFETPVLKSGWLSDPRLAMGFRSYNAKGQPTHIKMTFIGNNERKFTAYVPKESAVALISMPSLIPARFLTSSLALRATDGFEMYGTIDAPVYRGVVDEDGQPRPERLSHFINELRRLYGASGIDLTASVKPPQFIRFLCKIAHGFHVWERGMFPLKESPAIELLMARRTDYSNWVGGKDTAPSNEERRPLHEVTIEDVVTKSGMHCTLVNIALFNSLGPNFAYQVVTRAPGWQEHVIDVTSEHRPKGDIHLVTAL